MILDKQIHDVDIWNLIDSDKVRGARSGEEENSGSKIVRIENRECSKSICSADVVLLAPLNQVLATFIIWEKSGVDISGHRLPFESDLVRHPGRDDDSGRRHQRHRSSVGLLDRAQVAQSAGGCQAWSSHWTFHTLEQPGNVQRGVLLYQTGELHITRFVMDVIMYFRTIDLEYLILLY